MNERYTPGKYRDCPHCAGRGCPGCDAAADRDYKRAFPNGPQPLATFKLDSPSDMEALKHCFHADALRQAFGDGGGGMDEIKSRLASVGKLPEDAK